MWPGGVFGGRGAACRMRELSTRPRIAALLLTTAALLVWPLSLAFARPARSSEFTAIARAVGHRARANSVGGHGHEIGNATTMAPAAGPLAHAARANVNSVLPRFKLNFIFGTKITGPPTAPPGRTFHAARGTILLQGIYLFPAYGGEGILGGCSACTGGGHFLPAHRGSIAPFAKAFHHKASAFRCSPGSRFAGCIPPQFMNHTFSDVVRGKRIMGSKTRFVEAALGAEIGRFAVYGVDVARHKPRSLQSGCTPAYLDAGVSSSVITDFLLKHVKDLPTVPCRQRVPPGSRLAINLPHEFSSTSGVRGEIKLHASTPEWEIAFQEPASSIKRGEPNCLPNALAEVSRTTVFSEKHVRAGETNISYTSAPARRPGFTCVYLQVGGRVDHPSVTEPLPDGRVAATASRPFVVDTIGVVAPHHVNPGGPKFDIAVKGYASAPDWVYLWVQGSPCRATPAAEHQAFTGHVWHGVTGSYDELTHGWQASSAGTSYICAYLSKGSEPENSAQGVLAHSFSTITAS
jgi:hypothetical protein